MVNCNTIVILIKWPTVTPTVTPVQYPSGFEHSNPNFTLRTYYMASLKLRASDKWILGSYMQNVNTVIT